MEGSAALNTPGNPPHTQASVEMFGGVAPSVTQEPGCFLLADSTTLRPTGRSQQPKDKLQASAAYLYRNTISFKYREADVSSEETTWGQCWHRGGRDITENDPMLQTSTRRHSCWADAVKNMTGKMPDRRLSGLPAVVTWSSWTITCIELKRTKGSLSTSIWGEENGEGTNCEELPCRIS